MSINDEEVASAVASGSNSARINALEQRIHSLELIIRTLCGRIPDQDEIEGLDGGHAALFAAAMSHKVSLSDAVSLFPRLTITLARIVSAVGHNTIGVQQIKGSKTSVIKFDRWYTKLSGDEFTTIRLPGYAQNHSMIKETNAVLCVGGEISGLATVEGVERVCVRDIPTDQLVADTTSGGEPVETREEALATLQEFYPEISEGSEVEIISLARV